MSPARLRRALAGVLLTAASVFAQSGLGELRLSVTDGSGAGLAAAVELVNPSTNTRQAVDLPNDGRYIFKNLPFGFYRLAVTRPGFSPSAERIAIRSALPQTHDVTLTIQPIQTSVTVNEADTMVDLYRAGSGQYVGSEQIKQRPIGAPGRGLLELVVQQPGWAFEANGIVHPRESEYDTQFVVNGFPVYDNRSAAFAPALDADSVESIKVYTSGIPAEFGQKLGGVIEVNTSRNTSPGLHGSAALEGGSFATLGGYFSGQYVAGRTTTGFNASGFLTDHYLDPPVVKDYTNHASHSAFDATVERDPNVGNRLRVAIARRETRFLVPNDLLQQAAGQRQDRTGGDTEGQASYQHVFNPALLGVIRGMVRDVSARLWSNPLAMPISVQQDRGYREGYLNGSLSGHRGRHEWKTGVEVRFASVDEKFGYGITAYQLNPGNTQIFDPNLPAVFHFAGHAPDREQAVYVQDLIRLGDFTISAGLRFDHYSLLVDETGFSPRAAVSWHARGTGTTLHASYDRTFGTPPFENILVSAAPAIAALTGGLYLPLRPSRGNYYEGGLTQPLGKHVRLDASYFRRAVRDFKDDDLLLNTGVSFPISFRKSTIRGVEVKLEVPRWGRLSGHLSYSNTIGFGTFPISGGLFLDDGAAALLHSAGRFPISQDQRNTARTRVRYQLSSRLWIAASTSYSSGLPVQGLADLPSATFLTAQHGPEIVAKVNFSRARVLPSFTLNAAAGAELWRREKRSVGVQVDAMNLTDRLNLINFTGLLSGTAIAPPRSYGVRLRLEF